MQRQCHVTRRKWEGYAAPKERRPGHLPTHERGDWPVQRHRGGNPRSDVLRCRSYTSLYNISISSMSLPYPHLFSPLDLPGLRLPRRTPCALAL